MMNCYCDPGLALFLAELPEEESEAPPQEWVALLAVFLLSLLVLALQF